jgi:hypothetical protein
VAPPRPQNIPDASSTWARYLCPSQVAANTYRSGRLTPAAASAARPVELNESCHREKGRQYPADEPRYGRPLFSPSAESRPSCEEAQPCDQCERRHEPVATCRKRKRHERPEPEDDGETVVGQGEHPADRGQQQPDASKAEQTNRSTVPRRPGSAHTSRLLGCAFFGKGWAHRDDVDDAGRAAGSLGAAAIRRRRWRGRRGGPRGRLRGRCVGPRSRRPAGVCPGGGHRAGGSRSRRTLRTRRWCGRR